MGLPIIKNRAKVIINLNIQYIWPVSRSVVVRLTRFRKTWMETKEGDQSPSVKDDCSCLEYMCIRPYVQQICNKVLQREISRCAHTNLRTKWPFQLMLQNFHLSLWFHEVSRWQRCQDGMVHFRTSPQLLQVRKNLLSPPDLPRLCQTVFYTIKCLLLRENPPPVSKGPGIHNSGSNVLTSIMQDPETRSHMRSTTKCVLMEWHEI